MVEELTRCDRCSDRADDPNDLIPCWKCGDELCLLCQKTDREGDVICQDCKWELEEGDPDDVPEDFE